MTVAPYAEIKQAVAGRETEILDKIGIRWRIGQPHIRCPYLAHVDHRPSWRWDTDKRVAFCTCTDKAQSIFDVTMRTLGLDFSQAANRAAELLGRPDLIRGGRAKAERHDDAGPAGCQLADYAAAKALPEDFLRSLGLSDTTYARSPAVKIPYRATGGTEVAIRYRIALAGADRFRWAKGTKATLYGADRLSEARDAGYVVLVEGESDCQTLWLHGFPTLGLPGARAWHEDRDAPLLADLKTVYIVIEPDTGGAAVMKWLRRSSIGPRARLVRLKDAKDPSALHIADHEAFRATFQRALDEAEPYRAPEAPIKDGAPKQGRALSLIEPEPWPQPVDGGALLDDLVTAVRRYVVIGEPQVIATALWIVGTFVFDMFTIFPRLFITAPEKGCGKTTLLDVIERMVPRPLPASNITAPALFRVIEAARPTLLLDEADSYARDNEDLRGLINSGHKRNGSVIRVVWNGNDYEARQFSTWAPVALAAIGHLPGTVEDRSIIVRLKRRRPDEPVDSLRMDRPNGLDQLGRKIARWAADHAEALSHADPPMPTEIINRAADNWRPLLAISDEAGGDDWAEQARRAALDLMGEGGGESRATQLFIDINAAFATKNIDRLSSDELVAFLGSLDDRPWIEFGKAGRPITQAQLARLLKPFKISSGSIRLDDGRTPKGYHLRVFDDAFARYLPIPPISKRHTATSGTNPKDSCGVSESGGGGQKAETPQQEPSVSAGCGGVAVEKPGEPPKSERVRVRL